jgi:YidC/Oxa1 family membrane protein insertase
MGVTMYLQQKLNPAPADPVQARVFQFLPIMFTFMMAPFQAGLVIYWAWSNTLSIAQQYFIMRRHGAPIGAKAHAKAKATAEPAVAIAAPAAPAKKGGKGARGAAKKG